MADLTQAEAGVLRWVGPKPLTLDRLALILKVPRREVEQAVQSLRLAGHPIVSSGDGIRLSDDPDEVEACARRLMGRLRSQRLTAVAMRRTARRLREPAVLFPDLIGEVTLREVSVVRTDAKPGEMDAGGAWGILGIKP